MAHLGCVGEAIGRILFKSLHNDELERGVDIGVDRRRRSGNLVNLLDGDAHGILTLEGQLASDGLVHNDAERVDVACGAKLLALRLFRRNIVGGSQNGGGLRKAGVARTSDAEVHYLDVAIGLDHDVLRLDVAVDNAAGMRHRKRLGNLRADFRGFALVDGATFLDGGFKVGAAQEFHDDVVRLIVEAPVVDAHDVGALQLGRRGSFLAEALGERGVGRILGEHGFNGNRTPQYVVLCAVYLGHAAKAHSLGYLVAVIERSANHASSHVYTPFGSMLNGYLLSISYR